MPAYVSYSDRVIVPTMDDLASHQFGSCSLAEHVTGVHLTPASLVVYSASLAAVVLRCVSVG